MISTASDLPPYLYFNGTFLEGFCSFLLPRSLEGDLPSLPSPSPAKMPFLGQDWRSPGWSWTKTEHGWKRMVYFGHELEDNNREISLTE